LPFELTIILVDMIGKIKSIGEYQQFVFGFVTEDKMRSCGDGGEDEAQTKISGSLWK